MVRNFNDETRTIAYEPADMLSSIADLAEAATKAFGSQISAIKPTSERFNILNGINLGGRNYINIDGNIGFINIAGHEIGHIF